MNDLHATTTGSGQGRRRKLAAVLAGGLVLTTGAVTTLASWSDSEFAGATFTAGQFDLEGSIDGGGSFGQHFRAAQAGQLAFDLNVNNLAPGDTVNASFPVRLAAGTTNNARLRLAAATVTGSITGLGVIVWQNTLSADCSAAYNPSFLVAYVDSTTFGPAIQPTLSKGSPTSSAGAPVNVCFRVAASDSLPQAQSGSISFQFVATSQ